MMIARVRKYVKLVHNNFQKFTIMEILEVLEGEQTLLNLHFNQNTYHHQNSPHTKTRHTDIIQTANDSSRIVSLDVKRNKMI